MNNSIRFYLCLVLILFMILAHLMLSKYHCEYWYSSKAEKIQDTIVVNDDTTKIDMEKYCDPEHYSIETVNGVLYVHKRIK